MQTIEFNSVIENGIIHIPEEYKSMPTSSVHVIVLNNEVPVAATKKKAAFSAISIDTTNLKFDREEANARR